MIALKQRLQNAFSLTQDLYNNLSQKQYDLKIPGVPSNTFAGQAWCIVGARESYLKALENGKWSGFSCSIKPGSKKKDFLVSLENSQKNISKYLKNINKLNKLEEEILFKLLEHEIQHHGQLIRFVYANKLKFPKSWNERYTV